MSGQGEKQKILIGGYVKSVKQVSEKMRVIGIYWGKGESKVWLNIVCVKEAITTPCAKGDYIVADCWPSMHKEFGLQFCTTKLTVSAKSESKTELEDDIPY